MEFYSIYTNAKRTETDNNKKQKLNLNHFVIEYNLVMRLSLSLFLHRVFVNQNLFLLQFSILCSLSLPPIRFSLPYCRTWKQTKLFANVRERERELKYAMRNDA